MDRRSGSDRRKDPAPSQHVRAFVFLLVLVLLSLGCTPSSATGTGPRSQVRTIRVTDHGLRSDGQTDNTPAFQRLLDGGLEPGTVIVIPRGSRSYRFASTVQMRELRHVTIMGEAGDRPVLEFSDGRSIGLRLISSSDVRISGLHLRGAGVRYPRANAAPLKVIYSQRVRVDDLVVDNGITNGIEGLLSDSCVIEGNVVFGTKNHNGIGWAGGRWNVFRKNRCFGNAGQGMELRSQIDAVVTENECYENGSPEEQSSGITVECEDGSVPLVALTSGSRLAWRMEGPTGYGRGDLIRVDHPTKRTTPVVSFRVEADPTGTTRLVLASESVPGSLLPDRVPFSGADVELMDHGTHRVRVERNRVENNRGYGIYVVSSRRDKLSDVVVERNVVVGNSRAGIHVASAPDAQDLRQTRRVRIVSNVIERNGWTRGEAAVWTYFADSVLIAHNRIVGNARGDSVWNAGSTHVSIVP